MTSLFPSLPVLSSLSRPSDLFTSTAPYILTISLYNRSEDQTPRLVVNCSHEPTLKLLKGYLETWGKGAGVCLSFLSLVHADTITPQRQQSHLKSNLTLVESEFYPGTMDTLIVSPKGLSWDRKGEVNPTVILAFIEGVVGYRMVSTTGSRWMYRRDTQFS